MSDWALTGRKRYRVQRHWGKELLVLQVEVRGIETQCIGGWIDSETAVRWRDARPEDVTTLESGEK